MIIYALARKCTDHGQGSSDTYKAVAQDTWNGMKFPPAFTSRKSAEDYLALPEQKYCMLEIVELSVYDTTEAAHRIKK